MAVLWIVLAVLLVLFLMLFSHIHLFFTYTDALSITLRYWFVKFKIPTENKEKAPKEKKAKSGKEKKEGGIVEDLKGAMKKRGVSGFLTLLKDVVTLLHKHLRKIRCLVIQKLEVTLWAAKGDAAETASFYGEMCALVYPAVSAIVGLCKYKKYSVSVLPDFASSQSKVQAYAHVKIRLWHVLSMGLGLLLGGSKIMKELKEEISSEGSQNIISNKGGAVNEQSSNQ